MGSKLKWGLFSCTIIILGHRWRIVGVEVERGLAGLGKFRIFDFLYF